MAKKPGRKPKEIDREKLDELLHLGVPKVRIAKELKVGRTTLFNFLKSRSANE